MCSAASAAIAVGGELVVHADAGTLASQAANGACADSACHAPVTRATRFDLASLTKTYSARVLLGLVDDRTLDLDRPIAAHLPEYAADPLRRTVTLRHLLTHTSGLPATWGGWHAPMAAVLESTPTDAPVFLGSPLQDQDALRRTLARTALTAPPAQRWEYACTGYNTAMLVAEQATGTRWEDLVRHVVLEPAGLRDTDFAPREAGIVDVARTEHQPRLHRGVIAGDVHDESAWALGGRAANAGLFATTDDVLRWAETIRRGADAATAHSMWDDQLPGILRRGTAGPSFGASLGLRIGERSWMGPYFPTGRGHTGFTGTSFLVDRERAMSVVLLTNRVHPSRSGPPVTQLRLAVAEIAASCL
ncbi:serine hydrolase domain-containing protein [Curtobacterium sp. A7_M15]|nr:serine hydrolase domain-containing protein [Curtobacterium sp. A7_M15]MDP4331959.1 serine hydrolase domain-containing protein [Curtobacterium sp. A7_M15]